jgi:diguanylate cyclase (GGDEF)-like protein
MQESRREVLAVLRGWIDRVFHRDRLREHEAVLGAFVDQLTGLPTRFVFHEELRAARTRGVSGTVVLFDLDHFKLINDRLGHTVGDDVLLAVANRLRQALPSGTIGARVGGDEFAMFLPRISNEDAVALTESLLSAVRLPLGSGGLSTWEVTFSAGIATFDGQSIDDMFRSADVAMYAAKARGRACVVVFGADMGRIVTARRELASTVIELQRRNQELQNVARTDALTGLRNRLALDEVLGAPGEDALPPSAVAFIDVDHFGKYNKRYSDAAGDDALRAVAAAIRAATREHDLVFRKGGEEFVVVLPDLAAKDALAVAQRIRRGVEELQIEHVDSATAPVVTVTVSLATGRRCMPLRHLLLVADKQAMAAKLGGGRNEVHVTEVPDGDDAASTLADCSLLHKAID